MTEQGAEPRAMAEQEGEPRAMAEQEGAAVPTPPELRAMAEQGGELRAMADLVLPMAIRVAATLRLADHIAEGARTAADLARVAGADADALGRVMRYLVAAGVFDVDEAGHYRLTGRSDPLRDGHPGGLRAYLDMEGALGRAALSLGDLLHTARTGEAAYPARYGRSMWEDLSDDAALSASFDACMTAKLAPDRAAIVEGLDWAAFGRVTDVGGGDGGLLIALLTRYPTLRGTLVERSGPAEAAGKNLAVAGLADRGTVVTGSFFDPLPAADGAYLLCDVLHDWDDEAASRILRRCAEASAGGGPVLVIEHLGLDARASAAMDLRMLAWCGGRERNLPEIADLAATAGLGVATMRRAESVGIVELRGWTA